MTASLNYCSNITHEDLQTMLRLSGLVVPTTTTTIAKSVEGISYRMDHVAYFRNQEHVPYKVALLSKYQPLTQEWQPHSYYLVWKWWRLEQLVELWDACPTRPVVFPLDSRRELYEAVLEKLRNAYS